MGLPNKEMKLTKPGELRSFAAYLCVRRTDDGVAVGVVKWMDSGLS
jgi:hypothetical protein